MNSSMADEDCHAERQRLLDRLLNLQMEMQSAPDPWTRFLFDVDGVRVTECTVALRRLQ
jgi:hypothetical protein